MTQFNFNILLFPQINPLVESFFALSGTDVNMFTARQPLLHCLFQVHSPLNLKHPHDVVIFMRQDARVNYLKKLEVCGFHFVSVMCNYVVNIRLFLGSHSG